MIKPRTFIGWSLLFTVVAFSVTTYVPEKDFFVDRSEQNLVFLDRLPVPVFAGLKLQHVQGQPRFDTGLFGNSRSLGVGRRHLSLGKCSYFNFSVPSESLRHTVSNLERLQELGKAPRLALISFDNFELQRYNNPISPFIGQRWAAAVKDLVAGATRDDIGFTDFLRMGWRHLWIEIRRFRMIFGPEAFSAGLTNMFTDEEGYRRPDASASGYHPDGSREAPPPASQAAPEGLLKPVSQQIIAGYLRYDLERLSRLQKLGTRFIIYETPLEPKSAAALHKQPSPQAAQTRRAFKQNCSALKLKCYIAPPRLEDDNGRWNDHSHPPAKILGAYLRGLMRDSQMACME